MDYFNYCQGLTMTNERFHHLFGGPPRAPESPLEQRHMDLAASIQAVTEEVMLRIGRHVRERTGMKHLVLAGGVALNCVANGRLLREGPFDDLWIQPAAGDAGGALGAALFVWHQLLDRPRAARRAATPSRAASSGPRFIDRADRAVPGAAGRVGRSGSPTRPSCSTTSPRCWPTARSSAGSRAGWSSARGPWARGASWATPARRRMQATMNLKIKFRESFRPVRPGRAPRARRRVVRPATRPREPVHAPGRPGARAIAASRSTPRRCGSCSDDPDLRHRVNVVRSEIPAVTHVDYSARLQTVDEERNPRFHRLLEAFDRLTGCPVLVNTSFNVRGEPIVCTPEDAYRCFLATDMDVLVLEDVVVAKDAAAREAGAGGPRGVPGAVPARLKAA